MSLVVVQSYQNSVLPVHNKNGLILKSGSQTQIGYDGDTDSIDDGSPEEKEAIFPYALQEEYLIPILARKVWMEEIKTSLSRESI